jgi:hypothetical protein
VDGDLIYDWNQSTPPARPGTVALNDREIETARHSSTTRLDA